MKKEVISAAEVVEFEQIKSHIGYLEPQIAVPEEEVDRLLAED